MPNLEIFLTEIHNAEASGDHQKAAEACSLAGQIYLQRNIYPEAAHHFKKAADFYRIIGEEIQQAQSLNKLGVCQVMSGQTEQALEALSTAKFLAEKKDLLSLRAAIEGNIGLAYSSVHDFMNAAKSHKFVMETARMIGDQSLELKALINLADSNLQDKNYQPALGFALVALDLAKELDSKPSLVIIFDLLGMISSRQGDLKTALEYHQKSYEKAQENGDLLRQGIALANQALAQEGLTEIDLADQLMSQAQEIFILLKSDYLEKTRKDLRRMRRGLTLDP